MVLQEKQLYEAPSAMVVQVKAEGIICQSPDGGLQNYNWNTIDEE
jgi:hypothetical protein